MNLFYRSVLIISLGLLLFSCGTKDASSTGYVPVEDTTKVFSEDLVVDSMKLGEPISNTTVLAKSNLVREVAKTTKNLFSIESDNRAAMKIVSLVPDLSSCDLGKASKEAVLSEMNYTFQKETEGKDGKLSYSDVEVLNLPEGIFIDLTGFGFKSAEEDVEDGKGTEVEQISAPRLVASVDVLAAKCETFKVEISYKLSKEKIGEIGSASLVVEDLNYDDEDSKAGFAKAESPLETYTVRSGLAYGVEGFENNFLKVLKLTPSLNKCIGMTPSAVSAATAQLRVNIVATSGNAEREFIAGYILNRYESIDFSSHDKVYIEIDNIPQACEGAKVVTSYWAGVEKLSPEPARTCTLKDKSSDHFVTWFPKLNSLVLGSETNDFLINQQGLCNSAGILNPDQGIEDGLFEEEELENIKLELKTEGEEGNKALDIYSLKVLGQEVAEVSCAGPGRIRFNESLPMLFCVDGLFDISEFVPVNEEVPGNGDNGDGGDEETPNEEGGE